MDPRETEDVVHRALKALPPPRAPRTLLPRVMAAVDERRALTGARPARTWLTWPLAWQAASVAALVVLSTAIVWAWPAAWDAAAGSAGEAWMVLKPRVLSAVGTAWTASKVLAIVWETFLQPLVAYLVVWIVVMFGACAAFAAALGRVALGGAAHP